jgi:hypothetical protein
MNHQIASGGQRPPSLSLVMEMPPRGRHLSSIVLCVLTALLSFAAPGKAVAQGKTETPTIMPKPSELVVPSAESVVVMIRSTLLSLNDAVTTGNFTVLRDLAAPSFREANNAGRLAQIFSNLAAQRVNLAFLAIMVPKLSEPPGIDANRRLRIAGFFPSDPLQINFDLQFEAVAGQWRLFGISVNPTKPVTTTAAPAPVAAAAPAPAEKPKAAPKERPNK